MDNKRKDQEMENNNETKKARIEEDQMENSETKAIRVKQKDESDEEVKTQLHIPQERAERADDSGHNEKWKNYLAKTKEANEIEQKAREDIKKHAIAQNWEEVERILEEVYPNETNEFVTLNGIYYGPDGKALCTEIGEMDDVVNAQAAILNQIVTSQYGDIIGDSDSDYDIG